MKILKKLHHFLWTVKNDVLTEDDKLKLKNSGMCNVMDRSFKSQEIKDRLSNYEKTQASL